MPKLSFQSGNAFDAGLAAFAALSAGFVAFAMPEPILSGLVQASHLPDLVAAAQPPLVGAARFALVGVAALFTFAAVWALMGALGRVQAPRAAAAEPDAQAPRLRRADAHPDAPARRPLLARDLGEPLELDEVAPASTKSDPFPESESRPLPAFLVPQEPEPEPVAEAETEAKPAQPEPQPEPEPEAASAPVPIAELAAQLPESAAEDDQSLSQLVNRIEFGLTSRKRQALPAAELPPTSEPPAEQEKVGHRLRSAIHDLQKIASSGG
jgi:hypothetical protein